MKKWMMLSCMLLILSGCDNAESVKTLAEPVPDQLLPAQSEGISLALIQDEFEGSPAVIPTIVRNNTDDPYEIGPFYHLEFYKQAQWYIITYSDAVFLLDPHYRDGGIPLGAHSEMAQEFSVEDLGVTLYPRKYRLVKTITQRSPYHEITVAVPFTVY
ncbi:MULTISPECIES: immunoglobulin-like domain-containing protein [unclassified Sporosarcina]|uniref:immunoglobulin-like domain-containing protein n=1 Tax=unclassified Sporosarcina TaxID=2647733 RepID=UPI00204000C0|nr:MULTISPECIES: immunoglobulin-like domain-containing protein [unclassified Sporosarcina]GKV63854.1 hypothetical protein NCCP2331_00070 [Sporosarcina sp. NCCP-2331]GLB54633.1 hypothetical protein NCCP2378_04180 [Sporosarcina sp. NCCP-2378]